MNPENSPISEIEKISKAEKKEKTEEKGEKEKIEKTEERIQKLDEAFDDLFTVVKDAPEAKREALGILINDMRQQAEHISQVRDLKNFNKLKREMVKQWKELESVAGNDPKILNEIKNWGDNFIDKRLLYHELVGDVKDELADKATDVSKTVAEAKSLFGQIYGLCRAERVRPYVYDDLGDALKDSSKGADEQTDYEKFLASLLALEKGYDASDICVESGQKLVESMQRALRKMAEAAYNRGAWVEMSLQSEKDVVFHQDIPAEKYPQIKELLKQAEEKVKLIGNHVTDASKIFRVVKKLKDENFLPLYNTQGPETGKE